MKLQLILDDTPTGYALSAVVSVNNSFFDEVTVKPYGSDLPVETNTMVLGNFSLADYDGKPVDAFHYFPSYAPKYGNEQIFFNAKTIAPILFLGVASKEGYKPDNTTMRLINSLQAYSGKRLDYLNPRYDAVIKAISKVLTYANLYKEDAQADIISEMLTVGETSNADVARLVANVQFNDARYLEERIAKAKTFTTVLNADNNPKLDVAVVHADYDMQHIANEMAKRLVAKRSLNYMAITYKNGYVVLTSNVFEAMLPMFGDNFKYNGGSGTYSFFMSGLRDDTLFKALKTMFKEGLQ